MTLVQPDGSIAAMCGNGARVAAAWAAERTGATALMIDTPAGTRRATVDGDDVTIEMGVPAFAPRAVPLSGGTELVEDPVEGLPVTAVNTGVPHAVALVDDVDAVDLDAGADPVELSHEHVDHAWLRPETALGRLSDPQEHAVSAATEVYDP